MVSPLWPSRPSVLSHRWPKKSEPSIRPEREEDAQPYNEIPSRCSVWSSCSSSLSQPELYAGLKCWQNRSMPAAGSHFVTVLRRGRTREGPEPRGDARQQTPRRVHGGVVRRFRTGGERVAQRSERETRTKYRYITSHSGSYARATFTAPTPSSRERRSFPWTRSWTRSGPSRDPRDRA